DSPATASPVPSWRCKDSLTTGIRFHGGGSASCRELYNYCNHKTLDAHIRARCPMTCGACTPFLVKQVSNSSDSSSRSSAPSGPCEDDAADHVPVLFMGRKVMDCIDSKVFCFGHPNSKYIAKKCRATCGVCEVADAELEEADKMEPITTTLATVVAAAEPPPRLRWAELFSKAALGPVLVQAAGRRARRPRRRLRGPVPRRPQLGASVDAMPLGLVMAAVLPPRPSPAAHGAPDLPRRARRPRHPLRRHVLFSPRVPEVSASAPWPVSLPPPKARSAGPEGRAAA
ncbi:unnamed protein product, partial [Prorocentrum cordatum]